MALLYFCVKRLSILLGVASMLCAIYPAFSATDNVRIGSSWDVKALTSSVPLYRSELRVVNEDALVRQGVSLSPEEGEVLVFSQQRKIAILSKPLLSEGLFLYRENAGICWAINKPFPATLVLTNNTIIQKNEDGSELVIDASKSPVIKELTGLFTSIFAGNNQNILAMFDVYLMKNRPLIMPKSGWMLGMKPKDELMVGVPVEIRLLGEDNLQWVWFLNKAGDQTLIEFSAVNALQDESVTVRCFGRA